VVFNKIDRPAAVDAWPAFRKARAAQSVAAVAISAEVGTNLAELRERLSTLLPSAEELAEPPEPAGIVIHRLESSGNTFTVAREDGVLVVHGRKIERMAAQTNFDVEESAERFQEDLIRLGIDHELRRQGVAPGDMVRIGGSELEWEADAWDDR
jgi:GTP-binding protein